MGGGGVKSQWVAFSVSFALATLSVSTAISRKPHHSDSQISIPLQVFVLCVLQFIYGEKSNPEFPHAESTDKIHELEASLKGALEKCASERQGRIRAQKALREALSKANYNKVESTSYPMAPIGVVRSCFSTRNGTPRQPFLVPLAKASLMFDPARVPQASLEGLEGYSHCWILYVFHLNTDIEKLWKHPSQSKFKAKVRVPRLKGERIGVFATRSPHRPCPIGLTVAKVEAVHQHMVLLSGVDLVDGTPVLDIKPYLPYCDNIGGAIVPDWVKVDNVLAITSVNFSEDFSSSLADCWLLMEKKSLYSSPDEFLSLIRQVLSWDIRSVSQRSHPHQIPVETKGGRGGDDIQNTVCGGQKMESCQDDEACESGGEQDSSNVVYHLLLEGLDVSYRIDSEANVVVEKAAFPSRLQSPGKNASAVAEL